MSDRATTVEKAILPGGVDDASISSTTRTLKALIIGGVALETCTDVTISGDAAAANALLNTCRLKAGEG